MSSIKVIPVITAKSHNCFLKMPIAGYISKAADYRIFELNLLMKYLCTLRAVF